MTGTSSPAPALVPGDADGLVGGISYWPSNTLPPGGKYRFADHSIMSATTFSLLHSRIGDDFNIGGEGPDEFRLPPCEDGNFIRGIEDGVTVVGYIGGATTDTATTSSNGDHTHGTVTGGAPAGGSAFVQSINNAGAHTHSVTVDTVPPHVVMRTIIKVL